MPPAKKAVPGKGKIAFTTKDGKTVSFKSTGVKKVKAATRVKALEKRLSAMEKAVLHYNRGVEESKKKKSDAASAGTVASVGGGAGKCDGKGVCRTINLKRVPGDAGKLVGHAGK